MTVRIACLAIAALLFHAVLALPNYPDGITLSAFLRFQLELPVLLLCLVLVRIGKFVPVAIAVILSLIFVLKLADIATFSAFNRSFNPVIDLHLIGAGLDLLRSSVGALQAWAMIGGAALTVLAIFIALIVAGRIWQRVPLPNWLRWPAGLVAMTFAAISVADAGHVARIWTLPENPPGTSTATRVAYWHASKTFRTRAELVDFERAAKDDPYAGRSDLFDLTGGRDIWVVYVESYGRASFDNPLYAPTHVPTLDKAQADLAARGLAMRSGWLTSPVAGGQSWLAHATLSSGLKVADQSRYAAALASPRQTLFHLAQSAGYRTGAIMPAITVAWPEVELMGFDDVLPAADLGYAGQPFNWVTMPDQYTLSAFPRLLPQDARPDFLQMALISSHAPWVPVPQMVDWNEVGNGQIFDEMAEAGDPPEVVWRDRDRVRDQYRRAIDYSLQAVMEFAARQSDPPVIVVVGDHPAAGFVSQIEGRHVPIHIIAEPEIAALIEHWNWTEGLVPADAAPVWPMEAFRDRFIDAMTSGDDDTLADLDS